ncbi:MAG: type II transport protein GspH [Halioglobus sp.]|nr:type II transport protein GspH [Halioglobus sp.]
MSNPPVVQGFTLVELMLVLAVLAVGAVLAAPSLQHLQQDSRLRMESGRLLVALHLARSEAIMRNEPVSLCPSVMAVTGVAECVGTYAGGWLVYANPGRDKVVDPDTDEVIRVFEGLTQGYRLTNRRASRSAFELISYLPEGTTRSNRTFLFCPPKTALRQSRSIVVSMVGRARLLKDRDPCPVV